jgi:hypothetical protein
MADQRRKREDDGNDLSVHRKERIEGRDFAGASGWATEEEQTRDVRAEDMVGPERPDEALESGPVRRHDEEIE